MTPVYSEDYMTCMPTYCRKKINSVHKDATCINLLNVGSVKSAKIHCTTFGYHKIVCEKMGRLWISEIQKCHSRAGFSKQAFETVTEAVRVSQSSES